jgi:glycosyltransferase involved in cell wall biosynthesis
VTFAGLIDISAFAHYCAAADLFVLPSLLEALPTVAVEALASGTPVLSSDNPGGLELNDVFGPDVQIVPREQPLALAASIGDFLDHKRRTHNSTRRTVEQVFRPSAVVARYREIYQQVRTASPGG